MSAEGRYTDSRYMYSQPPPPVPPTYENYSYPAPQPPPSSYENSQLTPAPSSQRTMRSSSGSQPHSPPQPTYYSQPPPPPPPQSNYSSAYPAPAPYMSPTQHQWTGEHWAYPQSYQPPQQPPPAQEPPYKAEPSYSSVPTRTEPMPSSSPEQRTYPPPPPSSNQPNRRSDERSPLVAPPPPAIHAPQPPPAPMPNGKQREVEMSPTATSASVPPAMLPPSAGSTTFLKLVDAYRVIIDASHAITDPPTPSTGRSPPVETLDRMLQSAIYGVQLLEGTTITQQPTPSPDTRSPAEQAKPEDSTNGATPSAKKQKSDEAGQDGQTCLGCNATSTPEWRRGPMGPRTLCNACGLVYAKLIKKRVRESNRAATKMTGQNNPSVHGRDEDGMSGGEGDSDDDSYGSQDRRSDAGRD